MARRTLLFVSLAQRTLAFALDVIRIGDSLPTGRAASLVARQLIAAGSSPGAHFREAIRARSKSEYVSKLNGGLMELEETIYWLDISEGLKLVPPERVRAVRGEASQLIAIFVSEINKWRPRR